MGDRHITNEFGDCVHWCQMCEKERRMRETEKAAEKKLPILEQWRRHQGHQYIMQCVLGKAREIGRMVAGSKAACIYEKKMCELLMDGICPLLILTVNGPTEMLALEYTAPRGPRVNFDLADVCFLNPKHKGLAAGPND